MQTKPQIIMAGMPVSDWDSAIGCVARAAREGHSHLAMALLDLANQFAFRREPTCSI